MYPSQCSAGGFAGSRSTTFANSAKAASRFPAWCISVAWAKRSLVEITVPVAPLSPDEPGDGECEVSARVSLMTLVDSKPQQLRCSVPLARSVVGHGGIVGGRRQVVLSGSISLAGRREIVLGGPIGLCDCRAIDLRR